MGRTLVQLEAQTFTGPPTGSYPNLLEPYKHFKRLFDLCRSPFIPRDT